MGDERERVAEELRRIREEVRERVLLEPRSGAADAPRSAPRGPARPEPAPLPPRPDAAEVNRSWDTASAARGGLWSGLTAPFARAQADWNARQVQLDNALVEWVEARLAAHERRMAEIDERHLILQEELVARVQDLTERIDLALAEAERGRLSAELALRDLRARLSRIEERLKSPA
jgi:hypothetical protein